MPVFRFGVPQSGPFGESQFGPSSAGFLLLAGKPFTERRDQIIVSELEKHGVAFTRYFAILVRHFIRLDTQLSPVEASAVEILVSIRRHLRRQQ